MPTMRTTYNKSTAQKSKFSNFGSSKFATKTKNTEYFAKNAEKNVFAFRNSTTSKANTTRPTTRTTRYASRGVARNFSISFSAKSSATTKVNSNQYRPTMRGAMPSSALWSLSDEGTVNARLNYNRGLELNASAAAARSSSTGYQTRAAKSYFQGNAALKLNSEAAPDIYQTPSPEKIKTARPKKQGKIKKVTQVAKPIVTAIPGQIKSTGIFHSPKLSPMFINVAKLSTALVLVVACMAFVRVGFNAATVTAGIESNQLTQDIQTEVNTRNELKVQDSTLANSSRIRNAANDYKLVAPVSTEQINLGQDTLALDNNKEISLVGSLNRLSSAQQ